MSLVKSIGKQKVNVEFNKDFINLLVKRLKVMMLPLLIKL